MQVVNRTGKERLSRIWVIGGLIKKNLRSLNIWDRRRGFCPLVVGTNPGL